MKIIIDQTTTGLFKKWHNVHLMIELTPEERAALDRRNLWNEILFYDRPPTLEEPNDLYDYSDPIKTTIKRFTTSPFTCGFRTQTAAQVYINDLKQTHLPALKAAIEFGNKPSGPESFEM